MKLAYLINVYVATRLMVYAVRNVISISLVRTASDGKLGEGLGMRLIFNDIKHYCGSIPAHLNRKFIRSIQSGNTIIPLPPPLLLQTHNSSQ